MSKVGKNDYRDTTRCSGRRYGIRCDHPLAGVARGRLRGARARRSQRRKGGHAGADVRRRVFVELSVGCAGAPWRRCGVDRDPAAHPRIDCARGDRQRQTCRVRKAVCSQRRRSPHDGGSGRARGSGASARHRVSLRHRPGAPDTRHRVRARSASRGWPCSCCRYRRWPIPRAEIPSWWEDESEGGGWLGAYGSHVVDQIRVTLGEFDSVSATLQTLAPRTMSADDTYTVQFRLATGVEGIMHSSCAVGGQFLATTKITGSEGSAWLQGDDVWVDNGTGPRQLDTPDDLRNTAADTAAARAAAHHLRHVALDRPRPVALHPAVHGLA